eukprot:6023832-Amphidinium_carterae.1
MRTGSTGLTLRTRCTPSSARWDLYFENDQKTSQEPGDRPKLQSTPLSRYPVCRILMRPFSWVLTSV